MQSSVRRAVSLLELLAAICVLAVLIGLLLPAVQKVRLAAARMKSANKMRQLVGAVHVISDRDGKMPLLQEFAPDKRVKVGNGFSFVPVESPLFYLVQVLDPGAAMKYSNGEAYYSYTDAPHQSPADPNYDISRPPGEAVWVVQQPDGTQTRGEIHGNCSYVVNAMAAKSPAPLHVMFTDGTSNTVYLAETYCKSAASEYDLRLNMFNQAFRLPSFPGLPAHDTYHPWRRATFADDLCGDVHPVTKGSPAVTVGKFLPQSPQVTGETMFQCAVPLRESTGKVPYSPYSHGLQVGMADGSVRLIRKGVDESVFWGSVTPAGGEVGNLD